MNKQNYEEIMQEEEQQQRAFLVLEQKSIHFINSNDKNQLQI